MRNFQDHGKEWERNAICVKPTDNSVMLMASVKKECVKWLPDTFETKQKLQSFRDTSGLQSCPMFFCAFARLQSNGRDSFQGPQTHQKPRTHEGTSTGDFGAEVPGSGLWGLEFKVQGLGVRG